jgi:hypothetical protein
MSAKKRAIEIRKILRANDWGPREVSVRSDTFSGGEAVRIQIKVITVPLTVVAGLARAFETVDRCPLTNEILLGGNCYISVSYSWETLKEAETFLLPEIAAIALGSHAVIKGVQISRENNNRLEMIELPDEDTPGRSMGFAYNDVQAASMLVHAAASKGRWSSDE